MGRPSLAAERRRQIIGVTIQCMAVHGVAGTTLERIADAAGMARGHVRHYVGNREELLTDAARFFYFGEAAMDEKDLDRIMAASPIIDPASTVEEALDYLFGEFAAPSADNAAATAFVDAGRTIAEIHTIVLRAYLSFETALTDILHRAHPDAAPRECRRVAYAVLATAIGNTFMTDLELSPERIADARSAAAELIARMPGQPER
ncbi:TetR/AcrR family transcriptional regulator [Microbacterium azadirachtae]|uniref:DNA-binding transcriptional regulator, AcrR family n=1 Tax=Microbacterium azadirachtae TaxID=582680 RepID=A0A1I6G7F8_9MICO|nr:TetR/AcrR family transcriptional regulator [Microbacterium azadirachtae]SDL36589.1 DNA-binding transcriptional regulator, AcrR family [Microbacterium azadirachtae]SEF67373.1 DNA-binding transcriptional regulator, AcrR family [Microbacterium azadirachtae]SEF68122.1 DNA-binding transcriptional regulator, AcrR family [Microbacterium azadirachtae]SFR38119.1 DNA-binding transcriptional regulator, AcrR family [Microbacterium azadirachtae]